MASNGVHEFLGIGGNAADVVTPLDAGLLTDGAGALEHGKALQPDLSRHAILHGGDTNYGTELNALKVIMLIDYVQALANASSAESVGKMC